MTDRAVVNPEVVRWAASQAVESDVSLGKFAGLDAWIQGSLRPTFKQLADFAVATSVPLGYFFLDEVPLLSLPIADFRVRERRRDPSPELLDTITLCSARQNWYASYSERAGLDVPGFVGSLGLQDDPRHGASRMREHVAYVPGARHASQQEALRVLIEEIEAAGVLVVVNSVVENNTHRRLDCREFQGFTLVDSIAPLVFVNGDDTKNAQMFTLAHELAHVFVGVQGVSAADPSHGVGPLPVRDVEAWCNAAAAEFLMPLEQVDTSLDLENVVSEIEAMGRRFSVSTLVVLRRLRERGTLGAEDFRRIYGEEEERLRQLVRARKKESGGGDYYHVAPYRIGRRFARAIYSDTYEGGTTFRDAYHLLSIRTAKTFKGLSDRLGFSDVSS